MVFMNNNWNKKETFSTNGMTCELIKNIQLKLSTRCLNEAITITPKWLTIIMIYIVVVLIN